MNVEGCTALITGANRGLGRALAGMKSLTDTDAPSPLKPDDSSAAGPRFTCNPFPFSTLLFFN
jgi:hypothetical protein